jgi:hypothetical protein
MNQTKAGLLRELGWSDELIEAYSDAFDESITDIEDQQIEESVHDSSDVFVAPAEANAFSSDYVKG